jgi:hypothetical protein
VVYHVTNAGSTAAGGRFAVEMPWAVTDPQAPVAVDGQARPARETHRAPGHRLTVRDHGWPGAVAVAFPHADVWQFPLNTVSNSEAGFERTFQGVLTVCSWPMSLEPSARFSVTLEVDLGVPE